MQNQNTPNSSNSFNNIPLFPPIPNLNLLDPRSSLFPNVNMDPSLILQRMTQMRQAYSPFMAQLQMAALMPQFQINSNLWSYYMGMNAQNMMKQQNDPNQDKISEPFITNSNEEKKIFGQKSPVKEDSINKLKELINTNTTDISKIDDQNRSSLPIIKEEFAELNDPIPTDPFNCIKRMLRFFIRNVGVMRRSQLEAEGARIHRNDSDLKEIFMGLLKKFLSSTKTKEEKIKYILRKCFKFMKDKLIKDQGLTFNDECEKLRGDKIDKLFFKYYFSEKCGKNKRFLTKSEIGIIKDFVMPFRKNSQNKTMNIEFLKSLFSNSKFYDDFKEFITHFFDVTDEDNTEKIDKTASKIMDLMETKEYKGFSQKYFKRMPWLDVWRTEAQEVASGLFELYTKDELEREKNSKEMIEGENPTKKQKNEDNSNPGSNCKSTN